MNSRSPIAQTRYSWKTWLLMTLALVMVFGTLFSIQSCNACHGETHDADNDIRCAGSIIKKDDDGDSSIKVEDPDNILRPSLVTVESSGDVSGFEIFETEVTVEQYASFLEELEVISTETEDQQSNDCNGNVGDVALCYDFNGEGLTRSETNASQGGQASIEAEDYSVLPSSYQDHPVTYVSFYGAQAYCDNIGMKLPTEEQWELAANNATYPWGFTTPDCTYANAGLSESEEYCEGDTVSVFSTDFDNGVVDGIYHLAGNVAEWTQTRIEDDDKDEFQEERVVKGGSWDSTPDQLKVSDSETLIPTKTRYNLGFRCVK